MWWKRAKLVAKDDSPHWVDHLARIGLVYEQLPLWEVVVFADELDIHLLAQGGCAWMPQGIQLAVMRPGQNQKHYSAGVLNLDTGTLPHCFGVRETNALFCDLLGVFDERDRAEKYTRFYVS